jgi:hypothetical protein
MRHGNFGDANNVSVVGDVPIASGTAGQWAWGTGAGGSVLGSWSTILAATSYLAATDGFVQSCAGGAFLQIHSDSSNPPTTRRCYIGSINKSGGMSAVKKGNYYLITGGDEYNFWIPMGS